MVLKKEEDDGDDMSRNMPTREVISKREESDDAPVKKEEGQQEDDDKAKSIPVPDRAASTISESVPDTTKSHDKALAVKNRQKNAEEKSYVKERVARAFMVKDGNGKVSPQVFFGSVVEVTREEEPMLWRAKYDDGDSEDLDRKDLKNALKRYTRERNKDPNVIETTKAVKRKAIKKETKGKDVGAVKNHLSGADYHGTERDGKRKAADGVSNDEMSGGRAKRRAAPTKFSPDYDDNQGSDFDEPSDSNNESDYQSDAKSTNEDDSSDIEHIEEKVAAARAKKRQGKKTKKPTKEELNALAATEIDRLLAELITEYPRGPSKADKERAESVANAKKEFGPYELLKRLKGHSCDERGCQKLASYFVPIGYGKRVGMERCVCSSCYGTGRFYGKSCTGRQAERGFRMEHGLLVDVLKKNYPSTNSWSKQTPTYGLDDVNRAAYEAIGGLWPLHLGLAQVRPQRRAYFYGTTRYDNMY